MGCRRHDQWVKSVNSERRTSEPGIALLATLVTMLILGVVATIVLTTVPGPTSKDVGGSSSGTTTTIPQTVASGAQLAALTACKADFQLIQSALDLFRSLNGTLPPPGPTWATSASQGGPFVQSWPSVSDRFSLNWNGTTLSVIPSKGVSSHGSYGTRVPPTGCYAR
jgi:type II secretory pathway pseudopilin PulG